MDTLQHIDISDLVRLCREHGYDEVITNYGEDYPDFVVHVRPLIERRKPLILINASSERPLEPIYVATAMHIYSHNGK